MNWSMFDTEKFITEVQCYPALYDSKHDDYHNRDAKTLMWQQIGAAMYSNWETFSKEEIDKRTKELSIKWKSIRDHFVKDLKIFKNENLSRNLTKKKKYIYFDQLTFLLPTVDSRHFKSSGNENDRSESVLAKELYREEYEGGGLSLESGASNISLEIDGDYKVARKKRKSDIYEDCNLTPDSFNPEIRSATDVLEVEQNSGINNDHARYLPDPQTEFADRMGNKAFLISLLPFVNKIPDETNLNFRVEIMQIVQKYLQLPQYVCEKTE